MKIRALAPGKSKSSSARPALRLAFLASLLFVAPLRADRFRGQVRHEFLENIPVPGAQLEMVDANDPSKSTTVVTDTFGYFETSVFDTGDQIEIVAIHPAYQRETPTVTLASSDHFESILMTPLGNVTTDYHDIVIQISGAVTQLPLKGVPVQITRWDGTTLLSTDDVVTDAKGIAYLRGARTGFYEFKINDSSLPNTDRRARYEDYATPPGGRVQIAKNHLMNVFLKPLKQDLRVHVIGYEFERKEEDVPLGNVLVEIRGLDPADTTQEVLHARSDYTKLFPPGPPPTLTDDVYLISDGEVVFSDLPPIAYEVKIARYGYVTQRIILQPDPLTGLLPNDANTPLEVNLRAERHNVDVLVDYEDYVKATFDQSGVIASSGLTGLGLRVRLVGIEGTNTDGISYEGLTIQNLNGETYAPFFDRFLPGRYRVYVDGLSQEQPRRYNPDFDFLGSVGSPYDVGASGESILEIPLGYTGTSPRLHRFTVSLKTPDVFVRGQLLAAETLELGSNQPVFRPMANQDIEIVTNPADDQARTATFIATTTDADGRFTARVLPGLYGIRLPGLTDYFGDKVVVKTGAAAKPSKANRTDTYEWPLVEAFPDLPDVNPYYADRYFALDGIPIHAGREQSLELRVRRERYVLNANGTEQTGLNSKIIARTSAGATYEAAYSPTLTNATDIVLHGSSGDYTTRIESPPGYGSGSSLYALWENLPPGDYDSVSATIPGHTFATPSFTRKTFLDWPVPGEAPTTAQAALFAIGNLPNNEILYEPLNTLSSSNFEVTMDSYSPEPYTIYTWQRREIDGEQVEAYYLTGEGTSGYPIETSSGGGFYGGSLELGGPITAVWATGRNDENETYPVRMTAGSSLFLGGPNATLETPLPVLSYSLRLDGVAATDRALVIDGAHYQMGSSEQTLVTGQTLSGLQEDAYVYKIGGDNFYQQYQTGLRILENGANPTVGITVGLEQGMEVAATITDMTPIGSAGNPIDIPAAGLPVAVHNRYGRLVATETTDDEGKVLFQGLPGYADYFLSVESRGYSPVRRRLNAADATLGPDSSTAASHAITQDVVLLPRPELFEPGIPLNRWGLFLPSVSRSGNVKAEEKIKDFVFFRAKDTLTATWKIEVSPYQLDFTLPGFDTPGGGTPEDQTLAGPDAIVAAYLVDERRFQKDGFTGSTDPLENEDLFYIPHDDDPTELTKLIQTIRDTTDIQGAQPGTYASASVQRRVFVDPADTIQIDTESGRTVITGTMPLWELPSGDFKPVIVIETMRGAFRVYEVPYEGADAAKRLRGPALPPWFAQVLDVFGIASGVSNTQAELEKAFKDYVPAGLFIPLPDFSATIALDQDDPKVDEGFLKYVYTLAIANEIGQDSKAAGLLSLGPGILGAQAKVQGTLSAQGRTNDTSFELAGSITKENLLEEPYKPKSMAGATVTFPLATGSISSKLSSNAPAGASETDLLKFSIDTKVKGGAASTVSATLNNYARGIPYAGPVIGFLGDTKIAVLKATIKGRAAFSQSYHLSSEFPRERKLRSIERDARVPRSSFLGEAIFDASKEYCIGVGFATGLELEGVVKADLTFDVGGKGCEVSDAIGTMQMKINPGGGWPLITEISGEAKITAAASASAGLFKLKGEWEFAKAAFKVQFGTETVVNHYPFDADFTLSGLLDQGEGAFTTSGPDLVGGLAPAANVAVNGTLTNTIAYTAFNAATGHDVLRIARRANESQWEDAVEIDLAAQVGTTSILTLGDGRTLVAYSRIVAGQDPFDPYADHAIYYRIVETDGSVGPETYLVYLINPPTKLVLAESGNRVDLYIQTVATDGSGSFWQLFLTSFNTTDSTWGTTLFRINEAENFKISVTAGGPTGADETILHWVTESGVWKWMRSTDAVQHTVPGLFTSTPASWASSVFYELVAPTQDGTLVRYGQTALTGEPGARETLVEGVTAAEVALTQQAVTAIGGYLLAWSEKTGSSQTLSYLTYGLDGVPVLGPQPITDNPQGAYSDLILTPQNATAAYLFARFTHGKSSRLRFFELDLINGLADNDSDLDQLPDTDELRIVDVDPNDAFESVDDVLDGDDFDGDGVSNGDEIRARSDPINRLSVPALPEIVMGPSDLSVAAGQSASFSIVATGDDLDYQWRRNGVPIPMATGSTFTINAAQTQDAGIYDATVRSTGGTAFSEPARLTVTGGDALPSFVVAALGVTDLNGRDVAHMPLRIDGAGPKRLLLRALGPAIESSGADAPIVVGDPNLVLRDRLGAAIELNDNWSESSDSGAAVQSAATTVGALPLMTDSLDAALIAELNPGNYTVEVGGMGNGLIYVELFDLDDTASPTSQLVAVGLHSRVLENGFLPSLGFVVSPVGSRDLVSRYLGSALGTSDSLLDPSLTLSTGGSSGTLIGSNNNWETGNLPSVLVDSIHGLRLAPGSQDAARIDRLDPGSYILNASITSGDQGFGLLEVIDPLAQANPDQLAVLVPPVRQTIVAGDNATFRVIAVSGAEPTYQWNFNDQPITAATASTLNLANVQPEAEGAYTVEIATTGETITTAPAELHVLGGGPVRAAQSSAVDSVPPGGDATITVRIEWDETPLNLSYQTTLPSGWIMRNQTAVTAISAPATDATGDLVWQFGNAPGASPLSFTFTVEAPAEASGHLSLTGAVSHEPTPGNVVESEALPHPLSLGIRPGIHDADTDGNFRLSLSELLRVIELYNTRFGSTRTGRYRIQPDSTDGYAPDSSSADSAVLTRYHTADVNRDGKLSLSELLRVIELYNTRSGSTRTGAYRAAENTTDGFTPDP